MHRHTRMPMPMRMPRHTHTCTRTRMLTRMLMLTHAQAKVRFTGFEASWDTRMAHGSHELFPARPLHAHSLAVLLGLLLPLRHVCPMPF